MAEEILRWLAESKREVVLRLLRGESLEQLSRDVKVPGHRLEEWCSKFLAARLECLRAQPDRLVRIQKEGYANG